MSTILKVAAGIIVAFVALAVGAVLVIGGAASEVSKEMEKQQSSNSITQAEFRSLKDGASLTAVRKKFGKPDNEQTQQIDGLGRQTHLYYNVEGGEIGDSYQLVFDDGKLTSKNKY